MAVLERCRYLSIQASLKYVLDRADYIWLPPGSMSQIIQIRNLPICPEIKDEESTYLSWNIRWGIYLSWNIRSGIYLSVMNWGSMICSMWYDTNAQDRTDHIDHDLDHVRSSSPAVVRGCSRICIPVFAVAVLVETLMHWITPRIDRDLDHVVPRPCRSHSSHPATWARSYGSYRSYRSSA